MLVTSDPVNPTTGSGRYNAAMVDQALRDRVRQLTPTDRLDLISELWESLETDQLDVTAAERELVDARLADLQENPDAGRPWEHIEAELRARR
jgi:putative addiction module component (TIGR02574 family)